MLGVYLFIKIAQKKVEKMKENKYATFTQWNIAYQQKIMNYRYFWQHV